jgi:hypothetical protein
MMIMAANPGTITVPNVIPTAKATFAPIPNAADEDAVAERPTETIACEPVTIDVDVVIGVGGFLKLELDVCIGKEVVGKAVDDKEVLRAGRVFTTCPLAFRKIPCLASQHLGNRVTAVTAIIADSSSR